MRSGVSSGSIDMESVTASADLEPEDGSTTTSLRSLPSFLYILFLLLLLFFIRIITRSRHSSQSRTPATSLGNSLFFFFSFPLSLFLPSTYLYKIECFIEWKDLFWGKKTRFFLSTLQSCSFLSFFSLYYFLLFVFFCFLFFYYFI